MTYELGFGDEIGAMLAAVKLAAIGDLMKPENIGKSVDLLSQEMLKRMLESAKQQKDKTAIQGFENALVRLNTID